MMPSSWSAAVFLMLYLVGDFDTNFLTPKVNFAPYFVAPPGKATVQAVADHVEHIAKVAGKRQYVGLVC